MEGKANVQLYNTQGQLLDEYKALSSDKSVDVSMLNNGYYIFKVIDDAGRIIN